MTPYVNFVFFIIWHIYKQNNLYYYQMFLQVYYLH